VKNHSILLVDDEDSILATLSFNLEKQGYKVETAQNGEEGIKKFNQSRHDLVVTDLMMEGLNGIDVLKEVKKTDPDAQVIILSGHSSFANAVEALRFGAFDYLQKPCDRSEFSKKISNCLAKQEFRRQHLILGEKLRALNECKRIAKLIRNLQDFHRPSQEAFSTIDVNNIVDEVCLLIKTKMKKRKIDFNINLSEKELMINGVQDQLEQVILNLLQNAEEAITSDDGEINVKSELKDSFVIIQIQDTGCGIDPKIIGSVFEPFFTTKATVKGTGLGLSICHTIIKAHNGDIDIKSQPGQGTTITLSFPILRS